MKYPVHRGIPYNTKGWKQLGSNATNRRINTSTLHNGDLYVGGSMADNSGKFWLVNLNTGLLTDCGSIASPGWASDGLISHDGTLYVSVGYNNGGGFTGARIYVWDGATTWTSCGNPDLAQRDAQHNSLASVAGVLYAINSTHSGTSGTVYKYDGGTSWSSVGAPFGAVATCQIVEHAGSLFAYRSAASSTAVFVYSGSGTTWNSAGSPSSHWANESTNVLYSDGTKLWAGTKEPAGLYDCTTSYYTAPSTWTEYARLSNTGEHNIERLLTHEGRLYCHSNSTKYIYAANGTSNWNSLGYPGYGGTNYTFWLKSIGGRIIVGGDDNTYDADSSMIFRRGVR